MSQIAKLDGPGGIKLARSREPIVKANELLFVHFERPDIGKAERYLLDFGLTVVAKSEGELFMRGTGSQPYIYRISIGPEARIRRTWIVGSDEGGPPKAVEGLRSSSCPGEYSGWRLRRPSARSRRRGRRRLAWLRAEQAAAGSLGNPP